MALISPIIFPPAKSSDLSTIRWRPAFFRLIAVLVKVLIKRDQVWISNMATKVGR